jgi:transposase InsO family protein
MLVTRALEQLMKGKKSVDSPGSSGNFAGKKGGDRGDHGDRGKTGKDGGKQKKKGKFDLAKVRCYNCNEKGHFQSNCPEPKREKANFVQKEDDDPALLMLETCELTQSGDTLTEQVFLNEEKVVPKLLGSHEDSWYLDTGASNHMTGNPGKFAELDRSVNGKVRFGDGSAVEICGRGSVLMQCLTGEHRVLSEVYFIPRLKNNIISLGQLEENGCKYAGEDGVMTLWDRQRNVLARVPRTRNRMYILKIQPTEPVCLLAHASENAWLWHMRFGHINFRSLRTLAAENMVEGMPHLKQIDQICDGCMIAKQRRLPFPAQAAYRAQRQLELWHGDLCGPISPPTPGGKRYFLLLVDDFSRYMWIALLQSKDEAFDAIKRLQKAAEIEKSLKLKALRTDRGGEFNSDEFAEYCERLGIKHFRTAPYTPQQNGVVERRNQTVVSMARSLLKSMGVPSRFWGEAVTTAVYLLNRAPTKSVKGVTPYEAWHERKPSVHHLRTFGCTVHVKKVTPGQSKLSDRSQQMVFIGYEAGSKAYRMFDPERRKLVVARDVVFEEDRPWDWSSLSSVQPEDDTPLVVQYPMQSWEGTTGNSAAAEKIPITPATTDKPEEFAATAAPRQGTKTRLRGDGHPIPLAVDLMSSPASPANVEATSSTPYSEPSQGPQGKRMLADLYEETKPVEEEYSGLCLFGLEEPSSHLEAIKDSCWKKAMQEELTAIEENGTWTLCDLPRGHRPIGLKWVFKLKKNPNGETVKHKARLVAKGYVQRQGIDFVEAFAHRDGSSVLLEDTSDGCEVCFLKWRLDRRGVRQPTSRI